MELIIRDQFNEILFDNDAQLHLHTTKSATGNMSEKEFKNMLLKWKETVFECKPKFLLIDNRELDFPISPDLQEWITIHMAHPVAMLASVSKICYIMPNEFISKLSITQLTDQQDEEVEGAKFKYVGTPEEAKQWFASQEG